MEAAWVIVPTRNERGNIGHLVRALLAPPTLSRIGGVVVVDDSSTDGTAQEVADLQRASPLVHLVQRGGQPSFSQSYLEGFHFALSRGARVLLQMDADGSHQPSEVPKLLDALSTNDLAVGSRYTRGGRVENWGITRRAVSSVGNHVARILLRLPLNDLTSGFIAWRADAIADIAKRSCPYQGYVFLVYLKHAAHRVGLRAAEVPITFVERRAGRSKFKLKIIVEAAAALVRLATQKRQWL